MSCRTLNIRAVRPYIIGPNVMSSHSPLAITGSAAP